MSDKVGNITLGPDTPGPKLDKFEKMIIHTGSTETKRLREQRDALVRALRDSKRQDYHGPCWCAIGWPTVGVDGIERHHAQCEHNRALLAESEKEGQCGT